MTDKLRDFADACGGLAMQLEMLKESMDNYFGFERQRSYEAFVQSIPSMSKEEIGQLSRETFEDAAFHLPNEREVADAACGTDELWRSECEDISVLQVRRSKNGVLYKVRFLAL